MKEFLIKAYENAHSAIVAILEGTIITEQHNADGTFEALIATNKKLLDEQLLNMERYCHSIKRIA